MMKRININTCYMLLFLMLIWLGISSTLTLNNVILAIVFASLVTYFMHRSFRQTRAKFHLWRFFLLVIITIYELFVSSIQVAYDVLTRRSYSQPAMIKYHLNCDTNMEKMLLSSVISLTPGSLVVDLSEDEHFLYIHAMFASDSNQVEQKIKKIEQQVIGVFAHANDYSTRD